MKAITLLSFGLFSLAASAEPVTPEALQQEASALIKPFAEQLLGTVKKAKAEGGPSQAIEACQLLAPDIARQHSQAPWQIGRTALKVRNPDNAADAWEQQVLERFAKQAAAGTPLTQLRHGEVVNGEYRYMQAIGTQADCLGCHGEKIEPALLGLLDTRYPEDQARGFREGDLRGAFSLRRTLPQ